MRHNLQTTDNISSLSLLMSWGAGVAGRVYRVRLTLDSLLLDGTAEAVALHSIEAIKVFAPAGVDVYHIANDVEPVGGPYALGAPTTDPRQDVQYSLQFIVSFAAGTPPAINQLLELFGHFMAQDRANPVDFTWPVIVPNVTPITFKTAGGAAIPSQVTEITGTPEVALVSDPHAITILNSNVNYLLRADLPGGAFSTPKHYSAVLSCDSPYVVITEQQNGKDVATCSWLLAWSSILSTGHPVPYTGLACYVTAYLKGPGWSGPLGTLAVNWEELARV